MTDRPPIARPDDQVRIELVGGPAAGAQLDVARAQLERLPAGTWAELFCWRPGIEPPPATRR